MNHYDFDAIRSAADCLRYATEVLGMTPVNGRDRFNHPTRPDSNSGSFRVTTAGWYDHVEKQGGGLLELVQLVRGCDLQAAQDELGQYYQLTPIKVAKEYTNPAGWGEPVATYPYGDRHEKLRYHKGSKKTFRWRHKKNDGTWATGRAGLKMLYHEDELAGWPWVLVCEGEKDVDNALAFGLYATTTPDGAGSWDDKYTKHFAGKTVGIIPDGDGVGRLHADAIARKLVDIAAKVKVVDTPDSLDLTAWLAQGVDILEQLQHTPEYVPNDDPVEAAKRANLIPFSNYTKDGSRKMPAKVLNLVNNLNERCVGFPRRIGDVLFDHERLDIDIQEHTGKIRIMPKTSSLLAWIGEKTGHPVRWSRQGEGMTTQEQLYESLLANAVRYEGIYSTPTWPGRADVYYTHGPLPLASDKLDGLIRFFRPSTPEDGILLRVLMAAPMYFRPGIDRPLWIIDSNTGPRSGKSTLASLLSYLHGTTLASQQPIMVQPETIRNNGEEITKRVISPGGREKKVLLIDNVTGKFACPELAAMITAPGISGRAPYGRGEETRPNDLTFVLTANTAQVDTDLASRAFWINLQRPQDDASWKERVMAYINQHRMEILAELIEILERGPSWDLQEAAMVTRFPAFEYQVLATMAGSLEAYSMAVKHIVDTSHDANLEVDEADRLTEIIHDELKLQLLNPDEQCIFIRSQVVEKWVREAWEGFRGSIVQQIRNHAKAGRMLTIDGTVPKYPYTHERRAGVLWVPDEAEVARDDSGRPVAHFIISMYKGQPTNKVTL